MEKARKEFIGASESTTRKRAPKKRKRRSYSRVVTKVVKLARTKKDQMQAGKGKGSVQGGTRIVTYRKRKYRRRRKKAFKKKTGSNDKPRKRISKHLGLVKPVRGGSVPDVKSKPGPSTSSRSFRGPSLFGDRHQLMDFSENFHEEIAGPSKKEPEEKPTESSSSPLNLLDNILAGQKVLHSKSDDIIIKSDGSLVLKDKVKERTKFKKPVIPDKAKSVVRVGLSKHEIISKTQESSARESSPMLLAALARREQNEMLKLSSLNKNIATENSEINVKQHLIAADKSLSESDSSILNSDKNNFIEKSKSSSSNENLVTEKSISFKNAKQKSHLNESDKCSPSILKGNKSNLTKKKVTFSLENTIKYLPTANKSSSDKFKKSILKQGNTNHLLKTSVNQLNPSPESVSNSPDQSNSDLDFFFFLFQS
ncbi:PHD and RING finger domain-containing protein 1 [Caerostris extrusa]|uniref:PHD and RING finger domain-containing protein 1 n=1 Tax=Caerostris extrusa TaxID=172846 RepID=A0AAV4Y033_CAEEX|nr:PHD and RING finger domain-containing protein 1 [Caerostris extrusa]